MALALSQVADSEIKARNLGNFPPSSWGQRFATFSLDHSAFEAYEKAIQRLKHELGGMLADTRTIPSADKLILINSICRLGLSYHFEKEIDAQLKILFSQIQYEEYLELDLYTVSLHFRLFRQHGYKMPCDVFKKFKDDDGEFKRDLSNDVKGMLSFYDASQLRIRGEEILDEALQYTTTHLRAMVTELNPDAAKQVKEALRRPFHKGMPRVEVRLYISVYEAEESRNDVLLELAKLDFNYLQLLHQQELSIISKWWKDMEFASRLPHVRDRVAESYLWILGVFFEPCYSLARIILTKITLVLVVIDDTYDAYGTIDELRLFTDAVNRWDISAADDVPEYMQFFYKILLNLYVEFEEQLRNEGRLYCFHLAKEVMKEIVRAYHVEAEWCEKGYVAPFDEYYKIAAVTCGYHLMSVFAFVGMGETANQDAFAWIETRPKIIRASEVIARLQDDIVTCQAERERGQVASGVDCYMKEYGVTEKEAIEEFEKRIEDAWKDINEECLKPTEMPMELISRVLNLARMIDVIYKYSDGFTHVATLKDYIEMLFVDSVPVTLS